MKAQGRIVAMIILMLCIILISAGCSKIKPGSVEVKRPEVSGVTLLTIQKNQMDDYYETSGTVKARYVSMLSSKVMGAVTAILIKQGDRVQAGQLLLTIDDRDSRQKVMGAESGLREALYAVDSAKQNKELADVTYERYKRLFEQNAISRQDLDQVETRKKIADSEYRRAQEASERIAANMGEAVAYQEYTRITSPTNGVVTEKKIDVGSMAMPGAPLLVVDDDASFIIEANVDERLMSRLNLGMPVTVYIESLGKNFRGAIQEIVPTIDPTTRTFLVKISLDEDKAGLKTGLFGKVRFSAAKKEMVIIPAAAVVEKGQLAGVYIVNQEGVISYRLIKLGKSYGDQVEVLSGLQQDDRIIIGGLEKAIDGGVVKEVKPQ